MPEAGFPDTYHTETAPASSGIRMDVGIIRSTYGYTKIAEMAMDLLGFICIISGYKFNNSRGAWFNTVSMGGFWYSAILLALYVFHVPEKITKIPWKKIEFIFCCIWTLFYLIAASLAADFGFIEAFAAAAFFGFCAMVAYAFDAWVSFGYIQGVIVKTTTVTTTVTTPTTY